MRQTSDLSVRQESNALSKIMSTGVIFLICNRGFYLLTKFNKNDFIRYMKSFLFAIFGSALMIGCAEKVEPSKEKSEKDDSAISTVDETTTWLLKTYSSIENAFAKSEKDLVESDRSPDQILNELHDTIGALANAAKAKRIELDEVSGTMAELRKQFEKLAKDSPSSEREIYADSLVEIDLAFEEKVGPMKDFDFPYLEKFDARLKLDIERWRKTLSIMRRANAGDFREKLAELIAKHFEDNLVLQIKERRAKWSKSE